MYHIRVRACALIIEKDSVLLIEFTDEDGVHFNLPAGGTEPGETIIDAVKREAFEEAGVEVEVGELVFVSENAPHMTGRTHEPLGLSLMFRCFLKEGSKTIMPINPDPNQSGVKWVPFTELNDIVLFPNIKELIIDYVKGNYVNNRLIEEYALKEQLI